MGTRTDMDVDTIVQLLRFCVKSTEFKFDGTHYKQLDGVAMGSPVSPVLADLFMEELEEQAFEKVGWAPPCLWKRFVDDIILIFQKVEGRVTSHSHSITSETRNPCAHTESCKACMQTRELTLILINGNDKTFRCTTPSSVV